MPSASLGRSGQCRDGPDRSSKLISVCRLAYLIGEPDRSLAGLVSATNVGDDVVLWGARDDQGQAHNHGAGIVAPSDDFGL